MCLHPNPLLSLPWLKQLQRPVSWKMPLEGKGCLTLAYLQKGASRNADFIKPIAACLMLPLVTIFHCAPHSRLGLFTHSRLQGEQTGSSNLTGRDLSLTWIHLEHV